MDSVAPPAVDPVALTRALVDIDSTTGREGEAGRWLADYLRGRGFSVTEQAVDDERFNVIATVGERPVVALSTHFDCVPPFFPSRLERRSHLRTRLVRCQGHSRRTGRRGRSSCVGPANRGWVLCSWSAKNAAAMARAPQMSRSSGCRYLVDGEPTDNRLGLATRGILRVKLKASGRAAHSSFPELGESAIDKLIDALIELRSIALAARRGAGPHALHGRSDCRRCRAQRGVASRRKPR